MNTRLGRTAAALAFTAALAALAIARDPSGTSSQSKESMKKEAAQGPLKTVKCDAPCDFEVRGHDEKELIQIVKQHAKKKHDMALTDQQVREKIRTESAPR